MSTASEVLSEHHRYDIERPMAVKTYQSVAQRMAYELAMRSTDKVDGKLEGELPILFDRDEAAVTKSILERAFSRHLVNAQVQSVRLVPYEGLQNTFRIQFTVIPNKKT